jgi:hypothetical protein
MERDQEIAGDYGYDLAHEEVGRAKATEKTTGHTTGQQGGSASPVGGRDDRSEDFGYDQAHDF